MLISQQKKRCEKELLLCHFERVILSRIEATSGSKVSNLFFICLSKTCEMLKLTLKLFITRNEMDKEGAKIIIANLSLLLSLWINRPYFF